MTNILAIETATSACSVALRIDGELVVRSEVGSNIHSQVLLSMVASVLAQAEISPSQLDAVAVGQGPGSFTGLRIGVGVGQGLAYGAGCPMVGVSSLDALALQASGDGPILAAIDARMGEVYWCEYRKSKGDVSRLSDLSVSSPANISVSENATKIEFIGNAWSECRGELSRDLQENLKIQEPLIVYPSAGALLLLAENKFNAKQWISPIDFAPVYVRDNVAKKSTKALF